MQNGSDINFFRLPSMLRDLLFSMIIFICENIIMLYGFFAWPKPVSALHILLACVLAPAIAGIAVHTTSYSIQISNIERFFSSTPVLGAFTKHVLAPMFVDKQLLRLTTTLAPIIFVVFISPKPAHSSWGYGQTKLQSWAALLVHTTAFAVVSIDLRVRLVIAPQPGQRMWETALAISQLMITGVYYTFFGLVAHGVEFPAAAVYLVCWYPLTMAFFGLVMSSSVTGMLLILQELWAWKFPPPEFNHVAVESAAPVPGSPRDWFVFFSRVCHKTGSWILEAALSMLLAAYAAGCCEHFADIAVANASRQKVLWWPTRLVSTIDPVTLLKTGNSWLFWRGGFLVAMGLNVLCAILLLITGLRVIRVTKAILLMIEFRRIRWHRPEVIVNTTASELRKGGLGRIIELWKSLPEIIAKAATDQLQSLLMKPRSHGSNSPTSRAVDFEASIEVQFSAQPRHDSFRIPGLELCVEAVCEAPVEKAMWLRVISFLAAFITSKRTASEEIAVLATSRIEVPACAVKTANVGLYCPSPTQDVTVSAKLNAFVNSTFIKSVGTSLLAQLKEHVLSSHGTINRSVANVVGMFGRLNFRLEGANNTRVISLRTFIRADWTLEEEGANNLNPLYQWLRVGPIVAPLLRWDQNEDGVWRAVVEPGSMLEAFFATPTKTTSTERNGSAAAQCTLNVMEDVVGRFNESAPKIRIECLHAELAALRQHLKEAAVRLPVQADRPVDTEPTNYETSIISLIAHLDNFERGLQILCSTLQGNTSDGTPPLSNQLFTLVLALLEMLQVVYEVAGESDNASSVLFVTPLHDAPAKSKFQHFVVFNAWRLCAFALAEAIVDAIFVSALASARKCTNPQASETASRPFLLHGTSTIAVLVLGVGLLLAQARALPAPSREVVATASAASSPTYVGTPNVATAADTAHQLRPIDSSL